jgi:MraZ protein
LREYAGIEKDVVSIGAMSRVEIWSKERYEEENDFDDMDEIAEHMAELGIGI